MRTGLIEVTYFTEFEIPDDFNGNLTDYAKSNVEFPDAKGDWEEVSLEVWEDTE